jgi:predicted transcriptional regulator
LNGALTSEDLATTLEVNKTQLNAWLKKAVEDGFIKKYSRPVRYVALRQVQ